MQNKINYIKSQIRGTKVFLYFYQKIYYLITIYIEKIVINEIEKWNSKSTLEIKILHNDKLKKFVTYAYRNTEYYNRIIDENEIDIKNSIDFKRIPFLTKEIITKYRKSLVSRKYNHQYLSKRTTGGSTGKPLEFLCDPKAGLYDYAYHFYQYKKMGYVEGDIILSAGAIVVPEELRNRNIYWIKSERREAFGNYRMSILNFNNSTIEYYVQKLIELEPAILRGYPSFFDSLAQYILVNKIKLDFQVKGVNLTSEVCTDKQRINIEKAFSSVVYFEYGHTEISVLCHSIDNNYIYHSYPSYGYVEVLNDDGSETEIGEIGNIIVTGFLNKGMPFIRYKTEDLGRVQDRRGGIVSFSQIIGRSQDFIVTNDLDKISITALTSGQHLDAFANIVKWQIIQEKIGEIQIYIIEGENYSKLDENEIKHKIQNFAKVKIEFKYVESIPRTKSGKHLFMIQKVKL